jgi:hypothetical protein
LNSLDGVLLILGEEAVADAWSGSYSPSADPVKTGTEQAAPFHQVGDLKKVSASYRLGQRCAIPVGVDVGVSVGLFLLSTRPSSRLSKFDQWWNLPSRVAHVAARRARDSHHELQHADACCLQPLHVLEVTLAKQLQQQQRVRGGASWQTVVLVEVNVCMFFWVYIILLHGRMNTTLSTKNP